MSVEMRPLPRGRHQLSREQVVGSQRMRLLRAMGEVMAEKGYTRTSIADVIERARVSRETFYQLFSSKEDCFMGAFEEAYGQIVAATLAAASEGEGPPIERLSGILDSYLEALAADPVAARVFMIEVYAAGPAALERRIELQSQLVDALAGLLGARGERDRFAVEALIAAVVSMVTARLAIGDVEGLRGLRDPIVELTGRLGLGQG